MALLWDGLILVTALGAGVIAVVAWRNRPNPGTTLLALMMSGVCLQSVAHLAQHHATGPASLWLGKLAWVGLVPVPFLWFAFVLDYTGREAWLTPRSSTLLFAWPVLLAVLVWVPEGGPAPLVVWPQFDDGGGLVFWSNVVVSYGLLSLGSALLLDYVWSVPALFQRQGLTVLGGLLAGWSGSVVSVFGLFGTLHVHALQIGFALMGGAMLWATLAGRLTGVTPVAHRAVVETLTAGVVVVDADRRVVTMNPAARRLLGLGEDTIVVGRPADEAFAAHPGVCDWVGALGPTTDSRRETLSLDDRTLECDLSALTDARDRFLGGVLLLYDNTEQRRRQARLERQNEQLDEFASIVSHDLRNPLTVASGRVELARQDVDSPHLDAVEDAHARMEELIDDLLTLARHDVHTVTPSAVDVPSLVDLCWRSVETGEAVLGPVADLSIEGDHRRLRQLFENLFRNSVEHGSTNGRGSADGHPVVVTVGALDDGFYVADDGVGFDADDRVDVFEAGYSTSETGTGIGLNIVEEVATAHGWDVRVIESDGGGARVEFTNVTVLG